MKQYDYLIVGAGLYGSVLARELTDASKKVLVVERRDHIAGNIYTKKVEDIDVHVYGAHIFHTSNKKVWNYVNNICEFNNFINSPIANYNGEIYNMPFNMNTFARMFNIATPDEARAAIEKEKSEITGEPKNLEEQAISLVGRTIYEKLIKGYTEKQWGRDCKDLPSFIIKRLPVRFTYDNNYFDDKYQGIPEKGYTYLVEKLLEGIDVRLNVNYLDNKSELDSICDKVIYTGPLDEYYDYRFGKLEYRSLRFETEVLDRPDYQGNAVVNYTDNKTGYTRIIEHKHFNFGKQPKTVITKEYPVEWSEGMEAYYAVNDEKNDSLHAKYEELAVQEGLIFGGRLAQYKYYDMDDTIEESLKMADKLLER